MIMSRVWFMGHFFVKTGVDSRHTAVEPISFRVVCEAIAKFAFVTTDLPIIVSLEVHCNLEQQQKMVDVWPYDTTMLS